jgi:uncharacterized membrane protein SpoIIM required for sporulation
MENHCSQIGKIYIIIIICLIFTCLLTSINVISKKDDNNIDDNLFGTGIAINIIQSLYTIYLVYTDIFGKCKNNICGTDCKWYKISPLNKCTNIELLSGYIYIPIILISSAYLLGFGITVINGSNDPNDEKEITTLSIASIIIGVVGILLIFNDFLCNISCYCES